MKRSLTSLVMFDVYIDIHACVLCVYGIYKTTATYEQVFPVFYLCV